MIISTVGGAAGAIGGAVSFGITLIGTILSAIFGFGSGSKDLQQTRQEMYTIREQLSKAIDLNSRFSWKSVIGLGVLLKAVDQLWSGPLKSMIQRLLDVLRKLRDLAQRGLVNLARAMHKVREWMDEYYDKYARPVLQYIQLVRQYLAILRLFNIKWADKLDGILGRIQAKIFEPYLYIMRQINGLANWINVILTISGTFQAPLWINSAKRYDSYGRRILLNSLARPGGVPGVVQTQGPRAPMNDAQSLQEAQRLLAGFGVTYGSTVDSAVARTRAAIGV